MTQEKPDTKKGITLLSFMGSLISAWFGVATKEKRERDFAHGKFSHFIIGGIIFVILFILAVAGVVKLVMSAAGT